MLEPREILGPYPGLRPFEPHEAAIFFGREEHVGRLLEILHRERFIAVIGPSGCGKSSLVRAGMLPALTAGWAGTAGEWRIAVMRPGDRPMHQLARALIGPDALGRELAPDGQSSAGTGAGDAAAPIEAELRRGPLGLLQLVEDARRGPGGATPFHLLILVDQFEEIFRYSARGASQLDESDAFVNLLLASRGVAAAQIHVALAMRSDFLGNCVAFLDLPDAINRAQYLTPRLPREKLADAIQKPARVFGGEVEPPLVNELINAIARDPDQLPILQHALARMWAAASSSNAPAPLVTRFHLEATGGVELALSRHAESVLQELGSERRTLVEGLFRSITERASEADGRDTRRPQRLGDAAKATGCDWRDYVPVVKAFSREGVNFLNYVAPLDADSKIDISHEALIRQWPRLQGWVANEYERAGDYRRWRDRSMEQERGGEFLYGADLVRAREWLRGKTRTASSSDPGTTDPSAGPWVPTAGWAVRYALADDTRVREEFDRTVAYIEQSSAREEERRASARQAEAEARELERKRLEAETLAAKARAEVERQKAQAEREQARLVRRQLLNLRKIIAQFPDQKQRESLKKAYLGVKQLSAPQKKRLAVTLKSGGATGRARGRVPPQFGLKLWEIGATLRVRFMGGTPAQHSAVREAVAEWKKYANVNFVFDSAKDAEVRVAFGPHDGSWAYVGTDALAVGDKNPTMNLGWIAENVVHEFGHVLGLIHETNSPHAKLSWNKPAVYRDLGGPPNNWSKEQVDSVLFDKLKGIEYRPFDPESIMSYNYPGSWFRDGREIKGGKMLSKSDKEFIAKLYPRSPALKPTRERKSPARRKKAKTARAARNRREP